MKLMRFTLPIPLTEFSDSDIVIKHMGIRRWRKAVAFELDRDGFSVGLLHELKTEDADWRPLLWGYYVHVSSAWDWEEYHTWYDGENCAWKYGYIHFYRHHYRCEKCF